jgi:hypothetical protein
MSIERKLVHQKGDEAVRTEKPVKENLERRMKNTVLIALFWFFSFSNGYSQDTLVLKLINMQPYYEPCFQHWNSCGTLLLGKLTDGTNPDKIYRIHVSSTEILNRLAKNSTTIYRVVLRKRYSKDVFEKSETEISYSLIDIRSIF